MDRHVNCYDCGSTFALADRKRCSCGEPLWFDVDASNFEWPDTGSRPSNADRTPSYGGRGIWRYADVLPVDFAVGLSHAAGETPLLRTPQLESEDGPRLHLKLEGCNPTGSFKDRGSAVGISYAVADGTPWVGTVSHGNMALSVAAHAASAGLECAVFVPEDTPVKRLEMIGQHDPHLFRVEGDYGCLYHDVLALDVDVEFVNSDTPLRVAGQKTVAYEICEAFAPGAPDAIVLPVSSGGQASGVWKALLELQHAGLIETIPRLYLAQAARCDPIARAYREGADEVTPIDGEDTIAVSIANADPPSGTRALTAVRETGGAVLSIPEDEIRDAIDRLATEAGVAAEPSSAVALAAIEELTADGAFDADEDVVAIVTGSGYKESREVGVDSRTIDLDGLESELEGVLAAH